MAIEEGEEAEGLQGGTVEQTKKPAQLLKQASEEEKILHRVSFRNKHILRSAQQGRGNEIHESIIMPTLR